jgi:hypothetical protein
MLRLLRIDYANMQRTSRWTVSRPSLVVNNQEAAPRSSLRPQLQVLGISPSGHRDCQFVGVLIRPRARLIGHE